MKSIGQMFPSAPILCHPEPVCRTHVVLNSIDKVFHKRGLLRVGWVRLLLPFTEVNVGPNPFIGVIYHWIGGLASATNYIPFRGIKRWSWEIYWIIQGIAAWIIAPRVAGAGSARTFRKSNVQYTDAYAA